MTNNQSPPKISFAIDRGGTFTDLIAKVGNRFIVKKVLSRSPRYEESCSYAVAEVMAELFGQTPPIDTDAIEWIRMGTTIATNALLERKGVPTALVITKGFKDLLLIGDQSRLDIFALEIEKIAPLYEEVVEIEERVWVREGQFVTEKGIDEEAVRKALEGLKCDHLAVCLMHGYGYAAHEKEVAKIAESLGKSTVCSHEISVLPGFLARTETTLIDAYLTPKLQAYLQTFQKPFDRGVAQKTRMMQSDGSLCRIEDFRGSRALLSGPAGGVTALASLYEGTPLIGFDMGGTSTDVCRYDGEIPLQSESETAGLKVRVPQAAIHTVASGGGSRLFFEDGLLKVGPESSGADPGPLCYGRDGFLSVSDANLVTGRLDIESFPEIFGPEGDAPLDLEAAKAGMAPIAEALGQSVEATAEAFLQVADEQMASAIKEVTLKKGYDPAEHILCAFGGAGGQHAVEVARRLGIGKVVIHRYAGILSAYGMALAKERYDETALVQKPLQACDESLFAPLEARLLERVDKPLRFVHLATLHYEGSERSYEVPFDGAREAFEARHKREFGFLSERPLIVASVRAVAEVESEAWRRPMVPKGEPSPAPLRRRRLFYGGRWHDAAVYDVQSLGEGSRVAGPALLLQETATILLAPDDEATMNRFGDLEIAVAEGEEKLAEAPEAARTALLANRFAFIAKRMGDMLQKSAVSTNVKERLDFSCAIFDPAGNLVANAPHIPVHLGSMSSVVKALIDKHGDALCEGVQFVTNAPYEGGSHLPDVTVAAPCIDEAGRVLFWVAARGHHADIGGIEPGSMPPFSTTLSQEGALFESFAMIKKGRFAEEKIVEILQKAGARRIADNISDLKAQAAANRRGMADLKALVQNLGYETLAKYMTTIRSISAEAVRDFLRCKGDGEMQGVDRLDDGTEIVLRISIREGKAVFDFGGTDPQMWGNQNTPPAVVRSAVVYALRAMLRRDLPLNEGILKPVEIVLPKGSLLRPGSHAAVAGGNVTTSQRIVDLVLGCFGEAAASQGCMNNITFGGEDFGYYETIGGGAGATAQAPGADAVHTHMTNTRITDAEILERRYPVGIERFGVREGSGGAGRNRGGDGIVRIYRFFAPLRVSVLTERRVFAPFGLHGGGAGARGRNMLIKKGELFRLASKAEMEVESGDRLIVETPGGGGFFSVNGEK